MCTSAAAAAGIAVIGIACDQIRAALLRMNLEQTTLLRSARLGSGHIT